MQAEVRSTFCSEQVDSPPPCGLACERVAVRTDTRVDPLHRRPLSRKKPLPETPQPSPKTCMFSDVKYRHKVSKRCHGCGCWVLSRCIVRVATLSANNFPRRVSSADELPSIFVYCVMLFAIPLDFASMLA